MEQELKKFMTPEGTMPGPVLNAILDKGISAIAAWRNSRGLTQAELAAKAGCSQVWLSRIEAGIGHGTPKMRRSIAVALDAPLWTLDDEA